MFIKIIDITTRLNPSTEKKTLYDFSVIAIYYRRNGLQHQLYFKT